MQFAKDQVILAKEDIDVDNMIGKLKDAYTERDQTINEIIRNYKFNKYLGLRISKYECYNDAISSTFQIK